MKNKYLLFLLGMIFFCSCDESEKQSIEEKNPVLTTFKGEFIKRKRGVRTFLSDEFILIDSKTGKEKKYKTEFNVDDRMNFILDGETGDTLDRFHLLRNRKTWYLIRPDYSEEYSIQALKYNGDTLLGWNNQYQQMKKIDSIIDEDIVELNTEDGKYKVVAEKDVVRRLFDLVLRDSDARYIIKRIGKDTASEMPNVFDEINDEAEDNLISNLYPVPASNELNLKLSTEGTYNIEIMSTTGFIFYENQMVGNEIKMDLSEVPDGVYLILIKNTNEEVLASKKLLVEK